MPQQSTPLLPDPFFGTQPYSVAGTGIFCQSDDTFAPPQMI